MQRDCYGNSTKHPGHNVLYESLNFIGVAECIVIVTTGEDRYLYLSTFRVN